ncbi:replication initiation protein [Shewanella algae]|uniref:replication initiation protein n=1 Tax=Shewanella algae TaxID=38313 RepID=UPI003530DFFE
MSRILLEAPYHARCSDDKTAAISRPRHLALNFPYMQINRVGMSSWLIFDLDHSNPLIWEDAGLPPPQFDCSRPQQRPLPFVLRNNSRMHQ